MKNPLIQEKSIMLAENELGKVNVSYDAIKFIIMQVALDTPGVAEKDVNFITNLFNKKTGTTVIQDYDNQVLELDVSIKVYYGINIPSICREVQKLISFHLCQMLDLEKVMVNIKVDGLIVDAENDKKKLLK